jgi:hypothetical protein
VSEDEAVSRGREEAIVDEPVARYGDGWIIFAGIMMMTAGLLDIVNGLYAISHSDTAVDALFFKNNLEGWGWFYLIVGVIMFFAGLAVMARSQFARWIGILAAIGSIVVNMFWIFQYPVAALVIILIDAMVLYGLAVYGGREPAYR